MPIIPSEARFSLGSCCTCVVSQFSKTATRASQANLFHFQLECPLKNGVNQLLSNFCSLVAFNFISHRVGQISCVIVVSFTFEILSILTLTTAANSILVKVTPTKLSIMLVAGVSGQSFHTGRKLFDKTKEK